MDLIVCHSYRDLPVNVTSCHTIEMLCHGLRTPSEGINERYLKNWADVADKICFGRT